MGGEGPFPGAGDLGIRPLGPRIRTVFEHLIAWFVVGGLRTSRRTTIVHQSAAVDYVGLLRTPTLDPQRLAARIRGVIALRDELELRG